MIKLVAVLPICLWDIVVHCIHLQCCFLITQGVSWMLKRQEHRDSQSDICPYCSMSSSICLYRGDCERFEPYLLPASKSRSYTRGFELSGACDRGGVICGIRGSVVTRQWAQVISGSLALTGSVTLECFHPPSRLSESVSSTYILRSILHLIVCRSLDSAEMRGVW